MSRNVKDLHPLLQSKVDELINLCKSHGIEIGISECYRTVAEQDALYAKGRTVPGSIVTNARGYSYSSMHQWGVAFDFYLKMDVNKNGKTTDDAYNNSTGLFNKVGQLGKSIGLEWGGDWKSIKDLPHFQLPDWGSTTSVLRNTYKTPERFKEAWKTDNPIKNISNDIKVNQAPPSDSEIIYKKASKNTVEAAKAYSKVLSGKYKTTANLNLRIGAGTNKGIIITMPKGSIVVNYGYFTEVNGKRWYLIEYGKYQGYCSKDYLTR